MPSAVPDVAGHLSRSIAAAVPRPEPFPHLVVDDALPAEAVARLTADLPEPAALVPTTTTGWRSISKYQGFGTALLDEMPDRRDPDVWSATAAALLSAEVEEALRAAFARAEGAAATVAAAGKPLRKEARLDCATAGAHLDPHTDAPVLFMKILVYLAAAAPDPSLDTLLFRPRDRQARLAAFGDRRDWSDDDYRHEAAGDHVVADRIGYRPNRLFAFVRGVHSLHGLGALAPAASPRYLLALHYKRGAAAVMGRTEGRPVEELLEAPLGDYYLDRIRIHMNDSYAGLRMRKFPEDLRVLEQLLWEGAVDTVVEVGLGLGGSALWFRDRLRTLVGYGRSAGARVVAIDRDLTAGRDNLARVDPDYADTITLVESDVRDPAVAATVRAHVPAGARVLVVDDSAHRYDSTAATLEHFAGLVPRGGWLVIEDGHRDLPGMLPAEVPGEARGVLAAIDDWLAGPGGAGFARRRDQERYIVTSNPRGWLQRVR